MLDWILRTLFKNFGKVSHDVYRSGQPDLFWLRIMDRVIGLRTIINLAHSPESDKQDKPEKEWAARHGIVYHGFTWGAGAPPSMDAMREAVKILRQSRKPAWIHCEGGRDRSGGIAGCYRKSCGTSMHDIEKDWDLYGRPADGYVEAIRNF